MRCYKRIAINPQGQPMLDADVAVRKHLDPSTTQQVFEDALGTVPLTQPFKTDAQTGEYELYCPDERVDVVVTGQLVSAVFEDIHIQNIMDVSQWGAKGDNFTDDAE